MSIFKQGQLVRLLQANSGSGMHSVLASNKVVSLKQPARLPCSNHVACQLWLDADAHLCVGKVSQTSVNVIDQQT